jgi:nitroimidazol reductase NimA-like FMN-containing flavoprotein (pyridoxamine 5'-phosphate oxidase superfamily)
VIKIKGYEIMVDREQISSEVKKLFEAQRLGVLSTYGSDHPYSSLVAFAASEDLAILVFATVRSTRKYNNLIRNARVSLLVDNRSNQASDFHDASNQASDFHDAIAVTATGEAREVEKHESETLRQLYLDKHPYLREFIMSPTCALLKISVQHFYLVHSFQQVLELPVMPRA